MKKACEKVRFFIAELLLFQDEKPFLFLNWTRLDELRWTHLLAKSGVTARVYDITPLHFVLKQNEAKIQGCHLFFFISIVSSKCGRVIFETSSQLRFLSGVEGPVLLTALCCF